MKQKAWIIAGIIAAGFFASCRNGKDEVMDAVIEKGLQRSVEQSKYLAARLMEQPDRLPRTMDEDGTLVTSDTHWWCSGFFPGTLWMLYEDCGDSELKAYAENYTARIECEQYARDTHDLGFMMNCSFGNAYRITGNEHYKDVLLQSARSLATRFNSKVGVIRSWDNKPKWAYPVIIDNMMNLELLENANKLSGDTLFARIADSHARQTMANHFRSDHSSCHVVDYDTLAVNPPRQDTHQGYSPLSAWARGQAWGLYGYTMMYRETGKEDYLRQAVDIAGFILHHPNLPEDMVPYWDFDAPGIPDEPRDASAAAIIASALIELSRYVDAEAAGQYLRVAARQLTTLTSDEYLAAPATNAGFILKHSVGNKPRNSEVDAPLTYADYYYVEALLRYKKLLNK